MNIDPAPPHADAVILLRTHYVDETVRDLIRQLQAAAGLKVLVAADESRGPLDPGPGIGKIGLTAEKLLRLGLHVPDRAMWICGDYAFYVAMAEHPLPRHVWMVEPDLRFHPGAMAEFFRFFAARPDIDFLACRYGVAHPSWSWHHTMSLHAATVFGCMFPLTRIASRAIPFLLERRRALSRLQDDNVARGETLVWPNDEVFCATEMSNNGFTCRDVNSFDRLFYDDGSFSFLQAIALSRFPLLPPDGRIYHPVLAGEAFRAKLRARLYYDREARLPPAHYAACYGQAVLDDLAHECGEAEARAFAADLAEAAEAGAMPADRPGA